KDIEKAVGLSNTSNGSAGRQFVANEHLPVSFKQVGKSKIQVVQKSALEQKLSIRESKNNIFPGGQANYVLHECLMVVPVNYFHTDKSALAGTATLVTDQQLKDYLVDRGGSKSIFTRLGYVDAEGMPIRVTAKQ